MPQTTASEEVLQFLRSNFHPADDPPLFVQRKNPWCMAISVRITWFPMAT